MGLVTPTSTMEEVDKPVKSEVASWFSSTRRPFRVAGGLDACKLDEAFVVWVREGRGVDAGGGGADAIENRVERRIGVDASSDELRILFEVRSGNPSFGLLWVHVGGRAFGAEEPGSIDRGGAGEKGCEGSERLVEMELGRLVET